MTRHSNTYPDGYTPSPLVETCEWCGGRFERDLTDPHLTNLQYPDGRTACIRTCGYCNDALMAGRPPA